MTLTGERRQLVRQQLDQRRLAVAVGAEQGDAVVGVDPQGDAIQHRLFRIVADRDVVDRDDRRRQHLLRRREDDLAHILRHQRGDRLHPFQHFDARLGLAGLRGLGLEAVDEGLQALAFVGLALGVLGIEHFARGALLFERGIGPLVERQLAAIEMQDLVDRGVEQVAIVADDDHGARIVRQMILEPQRAFEVEIVGRLVQQQQIGRREQRRGERDPHAPAAGKFLSTAAPGRRSKIRGRSRIAAARAGAEWASMSTSRVWISAIRCGSCAVSASRNSASRSRSALSTTSIRLSGPFGASCARLPTRQRGGIVMVPVSVGNSPRIALKQRRFADAVAADEADARAGHDLRRAVVDQKPSGNPDRYVGD